jgi:hypothetical protein
MVLTCIFFYFSIHPTALATFAETTGGLALMSNLKKKDRAILVSIKMEVKSSNCLLFFLLIM